VVTALVLNANGAPVESLGVTITLGSSEKVRFEPTMMSGVAAGWYTVVDDNYTGFLGTAGDTLVFTGVLGLDTVSGTFVVATDTCRCHVEKVSGPDTLVLGL